MTPEALCAELSAFPTATASLLADLATTTGTSDRLHHRPFARALVGLLDTSRSITRSLRSDPSLLDAVWEAAIEPHELDRPQLEDRWRTNDPDPEALRRFKRSEFVRIAARDLGGVADLPSAARELAALADVVIQAALELADPTVPLAVIGMGKLGGRELNYSSDVDLMIVHEDDGQVAAKAVRRFLQVMITTTAAGTIWRTDLDLRPEGPAGSLSRTPESYGAYYARWGKPWEFQALIKTRYVAGEVAVSNRFFDAIRPIVWGDLLPAGALDHIRDLKERSEQQATAGSSGDVKRAPGGIRDVEFAVQLLQLVHGRNDASVRSPSTLEALVQLARAGHLDSIDAARLDESYCYLRTVEHRLQLRDERQTHDLPTDPDSLVWLARVLGYRQADSEQAVAAFMNRHERRLHQVRAIHAKLFHRRTLDDVAISRPVTPDGRVSWLQELGFGDPAAADGILTRMTGGVGPTSRLLKHLEPLLLTAFSRSVDPDLALVRFEWVTDGPTRAPVIAATLRDAESAVDRLARLLGASGAATALLRQDPRAVERVETSEPAPDATTRYTEALARGRQDLAIEVRRDLLSVMAGDLLDGHPVRRVGASLAQTARATLTSALQQADCPAGLAIIGLGRLGGDELSYSSDLDILFVAHDADPAEALRAARAVVRTVHDPSDGGRLWELDNRLRPEGENAPLVATVRGSATYYAGRAQTWELQAMLRVSHVAGDPAVTEAFLEAIHPFVFRADFGTRDIAAVQAMKQRIERERAPVDDRRFRHLKLGPGGTSDVDFTVQLLQLISGATIPEIRGPSVLATLPRLVDHGLLDPVDGSLLTRAYELASRLRNRLYLDRGKPQDELPADPAELANLAPSAGYADGREVLADWAEHAAACREVVERVFYGATGQSGT